MVIYKKLEALQKISEESEAANYRAISTNINDLLIKLEIDKKYG